jgi:hypothetical protein
VTEQRRLAAIVSADVAGYSRLMGRDESGTLAALKGVLHAAPIQVGAWPCAWQPSTATSILSFSGSPRMRGAPQARARQLDRA